MEQELITKRAKQVLKQSSIKEAPVDLERVLAYLRLHHERPWHLSTDVWDALTRSGRGRTRLKRQERAPTARERWRLAHEIGHHVLHGGEPIPRQVQWEKNELEHEADQFAAELLMPEATGREGGQRPQRTDRHRGDRANLPRRAPGDGETSPPARTVARRGSGQDVKEQLR